MLAFLTSGSVGKGMESGSEVGYLSYPSHMMVNGRDLQLNLGPELQGVLCSLHSQNSKSDSFNLSRKTDHG